MFAVQHEASSNADQSEICTHMLQFVDSSTLSGIHGFLNTSKQQVVQLQQITHCVVQKLCA